MVVLEVLIIREAVASIGVMLEMNGNVVGRVSMEGENLMVSVKAFLVPR